MSDSHFLRHALPSAVLTLLLMSTAARADLIEGEELADPTRPMMATDVVAIEAGPELHQPPSQRYRVSFTRSGPRPLAVINQQTVGVGDHVGRAEVLAISSGTVTILVDGEEHVLSTHLSTVKSEL